MTDDPKEQTEAAETVEEADPNETPAWDFEGWSLSAEVVVVPGAFDPVILEDGAS